MMNGQNSSSNFKSYKTPNEKFDEEFAELNSNPVTQKAQAARQASSSHTGYKTPNEKFDEEFADLNSNPVQQKIKSSQLNKKG